MDNGGGLSSAGPLDESSSRPRRRNRVREFSVKDELVLVAPHESDSQLAEDDGIQALTLNPSGRAIWELCEGQSTVEDIVADLAERFPVEPELLSRQVHEALGRMSRLEFIEGFQKAVAVGTPTTFVIGIEDKPYCWWQAAIFLESFAGKLPRGWRTLVVVCNNREPLSAELQTILTSYETEVAHGTNFANAYKIDVGRRGGECHSAFNRIEALSVAAAHVDEDDLICLLDSDIFLYGDLYIDALPTGCAVPSNWHIEKTPFFSTVDINQGKGVDLEKLLEALGCETPFKPGGVNVFITGHTAKNKKFLADCFRFAEALFLLGRIAGAELVWISEMPCFALSMTANGIAYDLIEDPRLLVSSCVEPSIPSGTLYHYYSDPGDFGRTAFLGSEWHKQAYHSKNFLRTDFTHFASNATTDHERYFFELAEKARQRLYA